ncbi:MAG: DUF3775 domain-containing protein [Rhodospirillales bacterium]
MKIMEALATDQVCYLIGAAREFEAEQAIEDIYADAGEEDEEPKQQDIDDLLASRRDDPLYTEIVAFVDSLNEDQQCELVALAWLGRGDFTRDEWSDALDAARERHNKSTADYLLGMPLLPDFLEEGLSAFGLSCE